jgi:hypothetical protein
MANVSQNTTGVDLDAVNPAGNGPTKGPLFKTGTIVLGDDGATYQYAKANASIAGGTSTVNITVSSGEYVAAATGGSATSPSGAMVSGDFAFFQL